MKYASYLLLLIVLFGCNTGDKKEIPVGKATKGTFFIDISEEGEVKAINSVNIVSPSISWRYGSLKITRIVPDGRDVKQGDTVLVFDPTEVRKAIVESESSLEINKAELERLKAQQESDINELGADLEVARLSQQISKIKFESSDYEAKIKKKEFELNLEQANIALEKANVQIENKKKIQAEEITQKMLAINQAQADLDDSYSTLQKLIVVTPTPGIAIVRTNWSTNSKYQVGDQSWSGSPIIELPDLNELKAEVNISEVDISKITNGLKVQIRPDAYSDSLYSGEVISVANLAINKNNNSRVKVFPVSIRINNAKNVLMPGLTVSCRIIINEIHDVVYVPVEAVFNEAGADFVYLKKGSSYKKTVVETGQSNTDFTIIKKGLEEGDEVTLINPFKEEGKKPEKTNSL
jgi:HlyD family secretion protein